MLTNNNYMRSYRRLIDCEQESNVDRLYNEILLVAEGIPKVYYTNTPIQLKIVELIELCSIRL